MFGDLQCYMGVVLSIFNIYEEKNMKKVFLVMLEDGTCVFSRVPGDANGVRRPPNFRRKSKDPKNDSIGSAPDPGGEAK